MKIDWIKRCIENEDYYFSMHADRERMNDNLMISDVEEALLSGRILENYPEDKRGESCLVVGFCDSGIPIHIVCGGRDGKVVIITVYIPRPPKFKTPYERG
ncbi:MAG: hypothetical protein QG657_476 [Acidobacteriota bacterium]|nr:hypothetical protein [Acidobacteriota bacterium]